MRTRILIGALMVLTGCSSAYEPTLKIGSLEKSAVLSGTGSLGVTIVQDPKTLKKFVRAAEWKPHLTSLTAEVFQYPLYR